MPNIPNALTHFFVHFKELGLYPVQLGKDTQGKTAEHMSRKSV